jgi:hypothetical protein
VRRRLLPQVRLYQKLRSAHLERAHQQTPASLLYVERRYDYDPALEAGLDVVRAGTWRAAALVALSRVRVLEINEPLVRIGLLRTLATVRAARTSARLRRQPVDVVAYAIENRDPFTVPLVSRVPLLGRARDAVHRRLTRRVARSTDRLAYGTPASRELYTRLHAGDLAHAASTLVPALPAACDCGPLTDGTPTAVVYVGAFEERKGVPQLLAAWPEVHAQVPTATLTLIGKGPLTSAVQQFASGRPEVTVVVDPPRERIHAELRRAGTLVMLSQPRPRWREQVGLPVIEGLAHGCHVVTTDQTGLADWLAAHGHEVTGTAADAAVTADAIVRAVRSGRTPQQVLADLPAVDGRLAADRWLFTAAEPAPLEGDS